MEPEIKKWLERLLSFSSVLVVILFPSFFVCSITNYFTKSSGESHVCKINDITIECDHEEVSFGCDPLEDFDYTMDVTFCYTKILDKEEKYKCNYIKHNFPFSRWTFMVNVFNESDETIAQDLVLEKSKGVMVSLCMCLIFIMNCMASHKNKISEIELLLTRVDPWTKFN